MNSIAMQSPTCSNSLDDISSHVAIYKMVYFIFQSPPKGATIPYRPKALAGGHAVLAQQHGAPVSISVMFEHSSTLPLCYINSAAQQTMIYVLAAWKTCITCVCDQFEDSLNGMEYMFSPPEGHTSCFLEFQLITNSYCDSRQMDRDYQSNLSINLTTQETTICQLWAKLQGTKMGWASCVSILLQLQQQQHQESKPHS